jgi:hypothetical protein
MRPIDNKNENTHKITLNTPRIKNTETWIKKTIIIPKDQLIYATKPAKHSKTATPLFIFFTKQKLNPGPILANSLQGW